MNLYRSYPPYEGEKAYLFLCFSDTDAALVRRFLDVLYRRGCRVWYSLGKTADLSERSLRQSRMSHAALTVLYLTDHARKDVDVKSEVLFCQAREQPVICVDTDQAERKREQMKLHEKFIAGLLAGIMLLAAATGSGSEAAASVAEPSYTITSKTIPYYYVMISEYTTKSVEVYYMNGSDIPYLELEDWIEMQKEVTARSSIAPGYDLTLSKQGDIARITRNNGTNLTINFTTNIMEFDDYNGFMTAGNTSLLDLIVAPREDADGKRFLKTLDSSVRKFGHNKVMDLGYYEIDLVCQEEHCYMPLQTLSDIFMAYYGKTVIYNGECILLYGQMPQLFKNEDGTLSELGEAVFGKDQAYATGTISETMAKFNYDELCFAFDNIYGLKDSHHILGFRELVKELGYEDVFLGTDSRKIDEALCHIVAEGLDDKHSKYLLASYASGVDYRDELIEAYGEGRGRAELFALLDEYQAERAKFYPDGVPGYEEIGNTAFITFDEFKFAVNNYYQEPPTRDDTDTIAIVSYAVQQILRPDSPIQNVVLDLSCNTGGETDAAVYTLAAFLGTASISVEDPNTGALATNDYMADTNYDHQFDSDDTLAGKGLRLYCLESSISFSCGNLVPAVFKEDPHVSLLGQRSSGGACSITFLSTATGSVLRLSSSMRLSYLRNGSFYDIDQGVEPDIFLSRPENFYDRENLVKYINDMML